MLVGPILGVIKRERKLINNGLKGKTNLCNWLFIKYNVGGPVLVLEKTVSRVTPFKSPFGSAAEAVFYLKHSLQSLG